MKAIIVDDEESARFTLRSILNGFFQQVDIVGEADNRRDALTLIEQLQPDVVFLDIQIGTESGLDVLESLSERNFQTIIVSAHKIHAFDSFRFQPTDYLLKPVRIKDLRAALDKVEENLKLEPEETSNPLLRTISQDQNRIQLVIPELEGFSVVRLSDIVRLEGDGNYTVFHLANGTDVTASKTVKDFEDLLLSHGFARIHRSHVVNVYHLARYIKGRGGEAIMSDGATLPVARDRKEPFLDLFLKRAEK